MSDSLAAVFDGTPGRIVLRHFPTPVPAADEMLVRVLGCTICGSDLHSFDGRRTVPVPTILGHEIVGEITALGPSAPQADLAGEPLSLGDRVTWAIVANCGDCFYCHRDLPQKCRRAAKYGHEALRPGYELLGGMAEHCLLPRGTSLVKLPKELPLAVACPANCATATVVAATEAAGQLRDRTVCILGAGLLGLTAAAMVDAAGGTAIIVDPQSSRRERALGFGAKFAITPDQVADVVSQVTEGFGVDAVVELSGAATAWDTAFPLLRTGGRLVLVGAVFPAPPVSFEAEQVVRRQLTIQGIHNYAPRQLLAAVRFLTRHHQRYPFASIVSGWHELRDIERALVEAHKLENVRVGIAPSGS